MALDIAQHLLDNNVFLGLGIGTILAIPPIPRYLQGVAQLAYPRDISAISGEPLPTITVTHTVRDTLTLWSEIASMTTSLSTITTTLIRNDTYTSFIPSTTLTETKTQILLKNHDIIHWQPSGTSTSTSVVYETLWNTKQITSTVIQGPGSTETVYHDAGPIQLLPLPVIAKLLLALLTAIILGLAVSLVYVLRARNETISKLHRFGEEIARVNTESQRQELKSKDAIITVQSRLNRLKHIIKTVDDLDIEDMYLDKGNVEYEEVIPTLREYRNTKYEDNLTNETLDLRNAVQGLKVRNRQLENQIRVIAIEKDSTGGLDRLVRELSSDLMLAEEKVDHLERRLRKFNSSTTAQSSN
jgi:hypothetical protein